MEIVIDKKINITHAIILFFVISKVYKSYKNDSFKELLEHYKTKFYKFAKRTFPSKFKSIDEEINQEVTQIISENFPPMKDVDDQFEIPKMGKGKEYILDQLEKIHSNDVNPDEGKLFAYCYPTNKDHEEVVIKAHNMFVHLNALNPLAFQSLRKMEVEVIQMAINMLNGDHEAKGTMTTGGTESILMAMKSYRDRALDLYGIKDPEVVLPITAHPAFEKAAKYFGITTRYIQLNKSDDQVNLKEYETKINKNTILLIASAPQYPHGLMDPIESIAKLAEKYKLPLHVDACIGGFFLPWLEKCGYKVPPFDFRIKQVTSISADIHKYGYATKGSSVLLFKNNEYRKYQFIAYTQWPGGLFVSPSMLGTRSGGNIAAAWTSIVSMGENGYIDYVSKIMATSHAIQNGIKLLPLGNIEVIGSPVMSIISMRSNIVNIHSVADVMEKKFGWKLERQHRPNSIHMTLSPSHIGIEKKFLENLKESVQDVLDNPDLSKKGSAAMYNGINNIPLTAIADDFLIEFLSKTYSKN
ncbi:hypothetical protein DICPUDRAFT_147400 [Dictyostelium purpureum]|uniref:sphinganine-1-phosphate aldolase n=1 Tax=Dictyostelium purpureum TaxID=5786 RepID=F0Z8E6_DICPU|nr:uncharacterized protein DICPUDRAFT_147400 [Dictyostelium purpureum]EGC39799.1 hypothetical protein DICPUDRAFT_147400 [Dictyostelium purpureum]|eukprot:XP_003283666.1 hypothetical protein DICPUDRAFT_147400 [Dictyostelium purpureum]